MGSDSKLSMPATLMMSARTLSSCSSVAASSSQKKAGTIIAMPLSALALTKAIQKARKPSSLDLKKFKPRTPTNYVPESDRIMYDAERLGPNDLSLPGAMMMPNPLPPTTTMFPEYRSIAMTPSSAEPLVLWRRSPDDGLMEKVMVEGAITLEKFGSEHRQTVEKGEGKAPEEEVKRFDVYALTYPTLSLMEPDQPPEQRRSAIVHVLCGVCEYLFSNQCRSSKEGIRVAGLPVTLHSNEQLFQVLKLLEIAQLGGCSVEEEWVGRGVVALLSAASPRECQVLTGPKGGIIPPEVFGKEGVMEAWKGAGVRTMMATLINAAAGCEEYYERWRSLLASIRGRYLPSSDAHDEGEYVARHHAELHIRFAEMREKNQKASEVWGSGSLLDREFEDALFEEARARCLAPTPSSDASKEEEEGTLPLLSSHDLFTPERFVLARKGEAGNLFGEAYTDFAEMLMALSLSGQTKGLGELPTHAEFCAMMANGGRLLSFELLPSNEAEAEGDAASPAAEKA